jgi:hypothetical protein
MGLFCCCGGGNGHRQGTALARRATSKKIPRKQACKFGSHGCKFFVFFVPFVVNFTGF